MPALHTYARKRIFVQDLSNTIKLRCVTHLYGWIIYGAFTAAEIEAYAVGQATKSGKKRG